MQDINTRTEENKLKIIVNNTGKNKAESLRLRIFPDPTDPIDFEKTNYFITPVLDINEETSVIISFNVLDFAQVRDYKIKVKLESLVGVNRYSQDDILTIPVTGQGTNIAQRFRSIFLIAAIAIAILLGGIVIFKKKPSKKRRKN